MAGRLRLSPVPSSVLVMRQATKLPARTIPHTLQLPLAGLRYVHWCSQGLGQTKTNVRMRLTSYTECDTQPTTACERTTTVLCMSSLAVCSSASALMPAAVILVL